MKTTSRRGVILLGATLGAMLATGCEVINPGPVADEYMTLPASQQGFVNGSLERLTRSVGQTAYTTALAAREIFPGGQTGAYGHDITGQAGFMGSFTASGQYNTSQQARWIAEEAIRQFELRGDVSATIMTQAFLWAGYSNRVLGDGWCYGVFDGGPLVPGKDYQTKAEGWFTRAIALAPNDNYKFAAYAGRAQARLWLEDFAGAISDARQVPTSYQWMLEMDFEKGGNTAQRNHIQWAGNSTPYRSYTIRFTFQDTYFTQTGDPRTPWGTFPIASDNLCVGSLTGYGRVPCTKQGKYLTENDDMRLASGKEMRLLEAEALLAQASANWPAAMTLINGVRTANRSLQTGGAFLAPWTATNSNEAWTMLKRERGIELWLEGRRYSDLRRWQPQFGVGFEAQKWPAGGVGGVEGHPELPNFAAVMTQPTSNIFTANPRGRDAIRDQVYPRELCYNISNAERNLNPNIDDEP